MISGSISKSLMAPPGKQTKPPAGGLTYAQKHAQKQGMTAYNAAGNQQKALYGSGQIPQSMKAAAARSPGGWNSDYDRVLKIAQDSWAKWQPVTEAGYHERMYSLHPHLNPQKKKPKPKAGGGGNRGGGSGGGYTGQSTIKSPNYIPIDTTEQAAQNVMALGQQQADPRYHMKQQDRAGTSRGGGSQYIAGQRGAEAMNQAAGQAADMRSQDMLANDKMRSDYEKAREMEAQSIAMSQHTMGQSDWQRKFAQQSAEAQTQMTYLQSLLGLQMSLLR